MTIRHGFITDEYEFLEQRLKLQQEMEQLTPVDNNDLERAADLLKNFATHWEACGDDIEVQSTLLKQVVERVYVEGDQVVAMTLQSNCHLVLSHNVNEPTEYTVDPFITGTQSEPSVYTSGDDGSRPLTCTRLLFFPRNFIISCPQTCDKRTIDRVLRPARAESVQ